MKTTIKKSSPDVAAPELEGVSARNTVDRRALQCAARNQYTDSLGENQVPLALTPREAAPLLRVGTNKIYELCHREDFPSVRVGNNFIIPYDALVRWLDRQAEKEDRQ